MTREELAKYADGQEVELWHWDIYENKPSKKRFKKYGLQFTYDYPYEAKMYGSAYYVTYHTLAELIADQVARREQAINGLRIEIEQLQEFLAVNNDTNC